MLSTLIPLALWAASALAQGDSGITYRSTFHFETNAHGVYVPQDEFQPLVFGFAPTAPAPLDAAAYKKYCATHALCPVSAPYAASANASDSSHAFSAYPAYQVAYQASFYSFYFGCRAYGPTGAKDKSGKAVYDIVAAACNLTTTINAYDYNTSQYVDKYSTLVYQPPKGAPYAPLQKVVLGSEWLGWYTLRANWTVLDPKKFKYPAEVVIDEVAYGVDGSGPDA